MLCIIVTIELELEVDWLDMQKSLIEDGIINV